MADTDDTLPFRPGDRFGDYEVERLLGRGSMGTVYLMRSPEGEPFAVKIMHRGKMSHDLRVRFAREAEFAMNIRHRNLVSVYDVGEDPDTGLCYIIMEYVPGGTLSDLIGARGKIPVGEAVKVAMHVAAALEVAHRNGLVHRDVKPDNVMFAADGTPKLADLGVAKFEDDRSTMVTMPGVVIGTPAYMSPEQLMDSHNIDARSDVYSLGVMLYEMLSGKRPNSGSTSLELLAKAIKGDPLPDIRTMSPEVSAAVAHVLSLMCAPKPGDRPATAVAAAQLLQRAATGKLVLLRKQPRIADAEARKSRRQFPAAAVVIGALFLVAAAAFSWHAKGHRASQTKASQVTAALASVVRTNIVESVGPAARDGTRKVKTDVGTWTVVVENGIAQIGDGRNVALDPQPKGRLMIPSEIDGLRIRNLAQDCFKRCQWLESVIIPEGVRSVGQGAFSACSRLESVKFKGEDVSFGGWAFADNPLLVSIDLPYGQKSLDAWAIFCNDERLESIALPDTVETIGSRMFEGCKRLKKVHFGKSLRSGNYRAFAGCTQLEEVHFPQSLTKLGPETFLDCLSLKRVVFEGNAPALSSGRVHLGRDLYKGANKSLVTLVPPGSTGWLGKTSELPERWPVGAGENARSIAYSERAPSTDRGKVSAAVPYVSKSKLHASYRSKDRNRVFVEVCHAHCHDSFRTPPFTVERVKEAISCKADIVQFVLCRSKDGVLFSAERERLEDVSDGVGSIGDHDAKTVRRFKVKQNGEITTSGFAAFEDMLKVGKGKILFKISGAYDYAGELEALLNRLDAWESVIVEAWDVHDAQIKYGPNMWKKMCSGALQVMVGDGSFNDWKDIVPECSVWGWHVDLAARGLVGIPQRVDVGFTYGLGEAGRTDDEAGWDKALKDGATIFRTNWPVELGRFLKKRRRWK